MKYTLDDTFKFGKYKGETLQTVADKDPAFIYWCHKNVDGFVMEDDTAIYCLKSISCMNSAKLAAADPKLYSI